MVKVTEDFEPDDFRGWLKLQRSLLGESWWFGKKPYSKGEVFLLMLAMATFKEKRPMECSGKRFVLVYGQAFLQKNSFRKRIRWSRTRLERFLQFLERQRGERFAITQEPVYRGSDNPKKNPKAVGTIITFVNIERL